VEDLAYRGEESLLFLLPVHDTSPKIAPRRQDTHNHSGIESEQEWILGYERNRDNEPSAIEEVSDVSGKGLVESYYQYRSHNCNQGKEEI
jgi:hypothetical protein